MKKFGQPPFAFYCASIVMLEAHDDRDQLFLQRAA
jgi:hypothetical protein